MGAVCQTTVCRPKHTRMRHGYQRCVMEPLRGAGDVRFTASCRRGRGGAGADGDGSAVARRPSGARAACRVAGRSPRPSGQPHASWRGRRAPSRRFCPCENRVPVGARGGHPRGAARRVARARDPQGRRACRVPWPSPGVGWRRRARSRRAAARSAASCPREVWGMEGHGRRRAVIASRATSRLSMVHAASRAVTVPLRSRSR